MNFGFDLEVLNFLASAHLSIASTESPSFQTFSFKTKITIHKRLSEDQTLGLAPTYHGACDLFDVVRELEVLFKAWSFNINGELTRVIFNFLGYITRFP